jgi:hypothetical protein
MAHAASRIGHCPVAAPAVGWVLVWGTAIRRFVGGLPRAINIREYCNVKINK